MLQEIKEGTRVKLVKVWGEPIPYSDRPTGIVSRVKNRVAEVLLDDEPGYDFWPTDEVEVVPPVVECSACGDPATHYVAFLNTETLQVTSINGRGSGTPSCDDCDGVDWVDTSLIAIRSKVVL